MIEPPPAARSAGIGHRAVNHPADRHAVADVAMPGERPSAAADDVAGDGFGVGEDDIGNQHGGALGGQGPGNRPSDAVPGAGHDRDLVG